MRLFREYRFHVGKKIEFSDLFSVIDDFLARNNLTYNGMGYDLEELEREGSTSSCQKLLKKMPQFGTLEIVEGRYSNTLKLSNMGNSDNSCDETSIRLLGAKIPRPYSFSETNLYYRNISFFNKQSEDEIITFTDHDWPVMHSNYIRLYRDFDGPKSVMVFMKMELCNAESAQAADDYANCLASCLRDSKFIAQTFAYLDADEQALYGKLQGEASPIADAARIDIYGRCDQIKEDMLTAFPDIEQKSFQFLPIIKRIGKAYGFDRCTKVSEIEYWVSKRLPSGYYLSLGMNGVASSSGVDAGLVLSGPGMVFRFPGFSCCPENSREAKWIMNRFFEVIAYFEETYLNQILANYPQIPLWYPEIYCD